jgi:hypothetical protein
VNLLKIDIEGAEEALRDSNDPWLDGAGAMFVEIQATTTIQRLNGYLAPFGFEHKRLGLGRESDFSSKRRIP